MLEALAEKLGPGVTMGDVLDAADGLGWAEPMGELTLADLAEALLRPPGRPAVAVPPEEVGEDDDEDDEDDDEVEVEAEEPPPKAKAKAKSKAKAKPASKSKPKSKAATETETKAKPKSKPAKSKSKSKSSTRMKTARLKALRAKVDAEDRMSLDEAAELLVPIVEELGQATMQDLEDFTGIGRRKLRFHIGQLVRHEYLERHGMGRGTYYTASE